MACGGFSASCQRFCFLSCSEATLPTTLWCHNTYHEIKAQILTSLSGLYNVQVTLNILAAVLALHPQFSRQQWVTCVKLPHPLYPDPNKTWRIVEIVRNISQETTIKYDVPLRTDTHASVCSHVPPARPTAALGGLWHQLPPLTDTRVPQGTPRPIATNLHGHGARRQLRTVIHAHHARHVGLHDRNHRESLLLHRNHPCNGTSNKVSSQLVWKLFCFPSLSLFFFPLLNQQSKGQKLSVL